MGGLTARRCRLFLRDNLPLPSSFTVYCRYWRASVIMPVLSHSLDAWFCTLTWVPGGSGDSFLLVSEVFKSSWDLAISISLRRRVPFQCLSIKRCLLAVGTPSRSCRPAASCAGDLLTPLSGVLRYWSSASAALSESRLPPAVVFSLRILLADLTAASAHPFD